jgi:beta-lactamase class A
MSLLRRCHTFLSLCVIASALAGCGGSAAQSEPAEPQPGSAPARDGLQATLDRLGAELPWRSPGSVVGMAVAELPDGARASLGGDVLFVSASSAKAWWVAAALHGTDIAAVEPHAKAVFVDSDNGATARVIDLIGPDRVNDYIWSVVGMRSTALTRWNYEGKREATSSPRRMGTDNYSTANDAVLFLAKLHRGEALDAARSAALVGWMKRAPRSGEGSWLLTRLPPAARASAAHKAGWLDPGCCSSEERYNTLNDIGLVTTAAGKTYAVAIFSHAGRDYWGKQVPFVEYASCEIYRAVSGEPVDCRRAADPAPPATGRQDRNSSSAKASAGMSQASAI